MKNKLILSIILIFFLITIFYLDGKSKNTFTYIGSKRCKECHDNDSIGSQYKIWHSSAHSRAVSLLTTGNALIIAKKVSVTDPSTNTKCLACHTTGGGKAELTKDEGVGCEACHGPGSGYFEAGNHVNFLDRKGAYLKAIKYGMYPVLGIVDKHLMNREKLCLRCHNETRPCLPADSRSIQMKKLSIQSIDKLKRGDVNIRHPLRRY